MDQWLSTGELNGQVSASEITYIVGSSAHEIVVTDILPSDLSELSQWLFVDDSTIKTYNV